MAEILGVIASAITVVELSATTARAISRLQGLHNEIQNLPSAIQDLIQQVKILEPFVREMEQVDDADPILLNDVTIREVIRYCRSSLQELTRAVDDLYEQINTQKRVKRAVAKYKVALKKHILLDFEKKLQKVVTMLSIAHGSYTMTYCKQLPRIMLEQLATASGSQRCQGAVTEEKPDMPRAKRRPSTKVGVDGAELGTHLARKLATCPDSSVREFKRYLRLPWYGDSMLGSLATHVGRMSATPSGFTEYNYDIRIQCPSWLASRAWDILITAAISGWKIRLRAWRRAPDSSPAVRAIKNNDIQAFKDSLRTGCASVFDRHSYGDTLLHIAIMARNLEFIPILVAAGLDFTEQNDTGDTALGYLINELTPQFKHWVDLSFFASYATFDALEEDQRALDSIPRCMLYGEVFTKYRDDYPEGFELFKLYILSPFQNLDLCTRLRSAAHWPSIPPHLIRFLLYKEGTLCKEVSGNKNPLWNFLAYFVSEWFDEQILGYSYDGLYSSTSTYGVFQSLLKEILDGGATDLHSLYDLRNLVWLSETMIECPTTPLIWCIWNSFDSFRILAHSKYWTFMAVHKVRVKRALHAWVSMLRDCGIDLEEYGRREQSLLLRNPVLLGHRWIPQSRYCRWGSREVGRIRNIRYGADPDDWEIEWDISRTRSDDSKLGQTELCFSMPGNWPD
ncbi:hypothetical protein F4776DRAFT_617464 [Hypoxylon sp. NC0597]|nr:hypothetical protein F4776DRAFT_617464 [Hypoxylon sp. NC0597]